MENKTKGASALELLFMAFILLKVVGIPPINGWSWFGLVCAPIYLQLVIRLFYRIWVKLGMRQMFYATLESNLYDMKLRKAIKHYEKLNNNDRDKRLNRIRALLEKSNNEMKQTEADE